MSAMMDRWEVTAHASAVVDDERHKDEIEDAIRQALIDLGYRDVDVSTSIREI